MATPSSNPSNRFTACQIDASFDMDDALTLPPDFGHQISESNSIVGDMPTVCSTDDVCSICIKGFQSGKRLPCGHAYHAACISFWLSNCNSCPLCRFNISATRK